MQHCLTNFAVLHTMKMRWAQTPALKGGCKNNMNSNNNQDVTPYDRMDDALLEQLLGTPRMPMAGKSVPQGGGVNCRGEQLREESAPVMAGETCRAEHGMGCGGNGAAFGVPGGMLAALYIPVQEFEDLYDEETALKQGTLFRGLDLPFRGGKGCK